MIVSYRSFWRIERFVSLKVQLRQSIYRAAVDRRLLATIGSSIFRPVLRYFGQPGLYDLYELPRRGFCAGPEEFSELLIGNGNHQDFAQEFDEIFKSVQLRIVDIHNKYPENFRVSWLSAKALYIVIRTVKPDCVIETGVANGISTLIIVKALIKNGSGLLYSIDVRDDVGPLLEPAESEYWKLLVLRRTVFANNLSRLISELPPCDIFLHDSNHSYMWQKKEYRLASAHLRNGGLLLSDDINTSWAFHELVMRKMYSCVKLVQDGKVFAGLRKD